MDFSIKQLIDLELARQENTINLIASENYASTQVLATAACVLTNKYAEGYPGKRYYGGCEIVDQVEQHAINSCKTLFGADHANVQPHCGSGANFAAYYAFLKPGDTVLAMNLAAGGHLTHGHKANFSGNLYNFVHYGVDPKTHVLDYAMIEEMAQQHKPRLIVCGASAYPRLIDFVRMERIAKNAGALLMVDMAHIAGLVAGGVIPSPIPHADVITSTNHKTLRGPRGGFICCRTQHAQAIDKAVMPGCQGGPLMHIIAAKAVAFDEAQQESFKTYAHNVCKNASIMAKALIDLGYDLVSGGTDTHLLLIDLRNKNITGKQAESVLSACDIIANRNSIPFEPLSPTITSGIRLGTPAITTRGCNGQDVIKIVTWIDDALKNKDDAQKLNAIKQEVALLCKQRPVYWTEK